MELDIYKFKDGTSRNVDATEVILVHNSSGHEITIKSDNAFYDALTIGERQQNPKSQFGGGLFEYAKVTFTPFDIPSDWTVDQKESFLIQHEERIAKAMLDTGMAIIHALLQADLDRPE